MPPAFLRVVLPRCPPTREVRPWSTRRKATSQDRYWGWGVGVQSQEVGTCRCLEKVGMGFTAVP